MKDYIKRFLIVALMAFFISLLFVGGRAQASTVDKDVWLWPADGVISDYFGTRGGYHYGIDIAGEWNSNIYSVFEGRVIKSYYSYSYGHVIFIEHPNGYVTVYAHLQQRLKQVGEYVSGGEVIGTMGTTGGSTGVHLHFEVHTADWNYAKSNVIDPFDIYGNMNLGQVTSVQERMQYVETVLHNRKREKLTTDGLWNNLDESESAENWLEANLDLVYINREESYHFISIQNGFEFTEKTNPISELNFSGIFLLLALKRRRKLKGYTVSLLPCPNRQRTVERMAMTWNLNANLFRKKVKASVIMIQLYGNKLWQYGHNLRLYGNRFTLYWYKLRFFGNELRLYGGHL